MTDEILADATPDVARPLIDAELVRWVESDCRHQRQLSEFHKKAVTLLCRAFGTGPWNIPVNWENVDYQYGLGVRFILSRPQLATFDSNYLTRLVIGAHDACIRVDINPHTFRHLSIAMWQRASREGELHRRHPTIEQAIEKYRGQ